MQTWKIALLLSAIFPAAVIAAEIPDGLASGALVNCPALNSEAAAQCLIDRLSNAELSALRVDRGFDPTVYRAITDAFLLNDASSPVSRSLADDGLYNADLATAIIIVLAQAKAKGVKADVETFRKIASFANRYQQAKRAAWQPPMPPGTKRVALKDCPDTPQRLHPQAVCLRDGVDMLILVTPNWGPEEAPRGN